MENLIEVKQLPIIVEYLSTQKEKWERDAFEAEALVCTEETLKAVKGKRTEIGKEFEDIEARRKAVKNAIMGPYNAFEAIYKDCITDQYKRAYSSLTRKINEVEADIKARCEVDLREYFDELCAVHHLDWLTYERVGIKVDMASAKAKTPKRLQEQLAAFVKDVSENVSVISGMDNAEEMMVEYQRCLNFVDAYDAVQERHRCIKEQCAAQEARKAIQVQEAEMVRRVEALAPPVVVKAAEKDQNEVIPRLTFTCVNATRAQLRRVREFLNMEGIQYE